MQLDVATCVATMLIRCFVMHSKDDWDAHMWTHILLVDEGLELGIYKGFTGDLTDMLKTGHMLT